MDEYVVLVDEDDTDLGSKEKLAAHMEGLLHRAFSIFIFNSQGDLLIQRRADSKYHSGGVWSNTCCSHPRPGEILESAAHRRLREEMGFDCRLKEVFSFIYKIKVDNSLIEHEYDHVLFGEFDGEPNPNVKEVKDWKWITLDELRRDMIARSYKYSCWLGLTIDQIISIRGNKRDRA